MEPDSNRSARQAAPNAKGDGEAHRLRALIVPEPLLWTLEQAAAALGLSPRSLKRAVAENALPPGAVVRPFGRRRLFSRLVLEEWCRKGCPAVRAR
jgi:hypothetical protein